MNDESKRVGLDVGVIVRDLDASSIFYAEVLGLPLHSSLAAPWPDSRRFASGSSLVKLTGSDDSAEERLRHGDIRADFGIRYFSVYVKNLDEVLARCASRGVPVRTPRTEIKPGRLAAIVEDPDGNPIELVEQDEE
jgi:catechol 2,3-dioxygenase-like lactoylglutathione lyase family enzyme